MGVGLSACPPPSSRPPAERVAAEADAAAREASALQEMQQQQAALAAASAAEAAAAAAVAAAAAAPAPAPHATAATGAAEGDGAEGAGAGAGEGPEEQVRALLETLGNSTLVLSEALASVPDAEPLAVREPFVAELADSCVRMRRRLERQLATLADEVGFGVGLGFGVWGSGFRFWLPPPAVWGLGFWDRPGLRTRWVTGRGWAQGSAQLPPPAGWLLAAGQLASALPSPSPPPPHTRTHTCMRMRPTPPPAAVWVWVRTTTTACCRSCLPVR